MTNETKCNLTTEQIQEMNLVGMRKCITSLGYSAAEVKNNVTGKTATEKYRTFLLSIVAEQTSDSEKAVWQELVAEMNNKEYATITERPLLQQILLHTCRDLYLDTQRAVKAANGDKSVKQFGPTFISKKHNSICMKDAMAKGAVKAAAEKVLNEEQQKKYIVFNAETKHKEFRQAVQVLNKLDAAGLIVGKETDKEYAKFYSVNPGEILAFLKVVGCLKK